MNLVYKYKEMFKRDEYNNFVCEKDGEITKVIYNPYARRYFIENKLNNIRKEVTENEADLELNYYSRPSAFRGCNY